MPIPTGRLKRRSRNEVASSESRRPMMKTTKLVPAEVCATITAIALIIATIGTPIHAVAGRAQRVQAAIWANDQLYDTVLTDTSFKTTPPESMDVILNFMDSGLS